MLYRDYEANEWKLMPLVATFLQHEKEHEQYAVNEEELRVYEEMGHITELTFEEAEYDAETIERLAEVKGYSESEFATVEKYVLDNEVLDGTPLALQKQMEILEKSIIEAAMMNAGGMF